MKILTLGFLLLPTISFAQPLWLGSAALVVKKDKLEAFKKAAAKIIGPTKKEKGCVLYDGFQVLDENGNETNRFEFHEVWTSKEVMLVDHKENAPHMKAFFKAIKVNTPDSYLESFELDGKAVRKI